MKAAVVLFVVVQLALTALATPIPDPPDLLPGQSITVTADGIAHLQEFSDGIAGINFDSPDLDRITGATDGAHVIVPISPL